ncbi:MAG: ATP-binding protein [Saprospiraceae bacterium]|nr:ATP-binding protein [Saprospiraceae bacterium]
MRFLVLFIVPLFLFISAKAQIEPEQSIVHDSKINFSIFNNSTVYNTDNGLPSSFIKDVKEDKNGYLWLATGKGVSRFDGSSFTNFNTIQNDTTGLSIGFATNIVFNTSRDKIWVTSNKGLFFSSIYNVAFYQDTLVGNEIIGKLVHDVHMDPNENIWLATQNNGLILCDRNQQKTFKYDFSNSDALESSKINIIHSLVQCDLDSNVIWLGTSNGLIQFNKITKDYNVFQIENLPHLDPNFIKKIETKKNKIIVGSWGSCLSIFDKNTLTFDTTLIVGIIRDLYVEDHNTIWCSTAEGILKFDTTNDKFEIEKSKNNIENGVLKGLSFVDSRGILWYKWTKGLLKYDPINKNRHFVELEKKNPLQDPMHVREILKWKNFYFVLGHNSKGLYKVNQDDYSFEVIQIPGLANNDGYYPFRDMIHMDDGNILIASHNKIVIFNPGSNTIKDLPIKVNFAQPAIQVFEKDSKNNYWIATRKAGLFRLNFENNIVVNYKDEFNTYSEKGYWWMQNLLVDSNNKLWIDSKTLSVMDLDDYSIKTLPETDTINYFNDIGSIVEDISGKIWLSGYSRGIGNITYENFNAGIIQQKTEYFSKLYPYSDSIFYTLNRELGQLNVNTLDQRNYNFEMHDIKLDGPFVKGKNNNLIVGADNGLFVFNLDKQNKNTELPQPKIVELRVDGNTLYKGENLAKTEFDLNSKTKNIHLIVSSFGFHYSDKTTFEYKIENNWIKLDKGRLINLSNLRPGKFTIELRACNNRGICNTEKVVYKFNIQTPWYKSFLAFFIYFLLTIALIYALYKFQISKKLAVLESERLKDLYRIKTNLYTNITHEFRTPLTVIQGLAESVQNDIKRNKNEKSDYALNLIQKNSTGLLLLVNEMLDLAKIESGHLELQSQQGDVIPFIKYLVESFHSYAQTKNLSLTVYSEIDTLVMDYDAAKLSSIISNLLSNAIKFTPENGKIIVHLNHIQEKDDGFFVIKIKDNGIGIPNADLEDVFNRFYQVGSSLSSKNEGTGIGLTLTKELVELMNGSITLKSTINHGSTFTVRLPITNVSLDTHNNKFEQENFIVASNKTIIDTERWENIVDEHLPTALIIEDNPDVSYYIQVCLEGKYNTIHAEDGLIGIKKAIEHIPDIIISDIMMPGKNGLEVCSELKENELTDHIPIILLSAKATISDKIDGLAQGADAYLEKPFVKEELYIRLEQLVLQRKKLIKKFKGSSLAKLNVSTKDEKELKFLKKAIQIIEENISDNTFGVLQLARKLLLSESQVYRKLKATTDVSTAVFIRSVRLQQGKLIIENSNKPISEIAYEVGFNDPAYFSRAFKDEFGIPPSDLK